MPNANISPTGPFQNLGAQPRLIEKQDAPKEVQSALARRAFFDADYQADVFARATPEGEEFVIVTTREAVGANNHSAWASKTAFFSHAFPPLALALSLQEFVAGATAFIPQDRPQKNVTTAISGGAKFGLLSAAGFMALTGNIPGAILAWGASAGVAAFGWAKNVRELERTTAERKAIVGDERV